MQLKALSPNTESYNAACNLGFYVYLLSVVILFSVALLNVFINTEAHCLHSHFTALCFTRGVYSGMHQDVGVFYRS